MPFRTARGIFTDDETSDPAIEADVVMTAAVLGLAADQVGRGERLRFDIETSERDEKWASFAKLSNLVDELIARHLDITDKVPVGQVHAGTCPDYAKGAVIIGIYQWAGHERPVSVVDPVLSARGRILYEQIKNEQIPQYTGRGAYTGFVDDNRPDGTGRPVGPRPTVRFLAPTADPDQAPALGAHPRWLPPGDSSLWAPRRRRDGSTVPWGLIGGNLAQRPAEHPTGECSHVTNMSDQITCEMRAKYGMEFAGDPTPQDIAGYTHGMIQAIYKAYALGPSCTPFEIAVGTQTSKMASCIPCTMFMIAQGYPPTSIHLGRGESWVPLFEPHDPNGSPEPHELAVIRDLNQAWRDACAEFLELGLLVLSLAQMPAGHAQAAQRLLDYLARGGTDRSTASTLILDALTIHDSEFARLARTLSLDGR